MAAERLAAGGGVFRTLNVIDQVRQIAAEWFELYNEIRPRDALGSLPPARYREPLIAGETNVY